MSGRLRRVDRKRRMREYDPTAACQDAPAPFVGIRKHLEQPSQEFSRREAIIKIAKQRFEAAEFLRNSRRIHGTRPVDASNEVCQSINFDPMPCGIAYGSEDVGFLNAINRS